VNGQELLLVHIGTYWYMFVCNSLFCFLIVAQRRDYQKWSLGNWMKEILLNNINDVVAARLSHVGRDAIRRLRCATPPVMHHTVASATKINFTLSFQFKRLH
jgi:hypothetical protein